MQNGSLISAKIVKFYNNCCVETRAVGDEVRHYTNNCINFDVIYAIVQAEAAGKPETVIEDFCAFKYEQHLRCYDKLLSVFRESLLVIRALGGNLQALHLHWLGSNHKQLQLWYATEAATATVEQVLLLTAMLEFALGNVYYTCSAGRAPPHLLKDLLNTRELLEVFGVGTIVFLKILLGTPNFINLRNIVWHGFPQPHELPAYYASLLLLTVHTLGVTLAEQKFELQKRIQIQDFSNFITKLEPHFPSYILDHEQQQQLLCTCHWLSDAHKIYWQQLFCYYNSGNYMKFVILILPQIELLLRLIYAGANDYDVRAKLDEYYITLDTIFEAVVPATAEAACRSNQLLLLPAQNHISDGALHCLYDLFVAPCGPRLRDKVSHGEVHMAAINDATLCRILLHLSLNLITCNEHFSLTSYESQFHLNALTKSAAEQAQMNLQQFMQQHFKDQIEFPVSSKENLAATYGRIHIFQRPKKEAELMNIILKIYQYLAQIATNYEAALEERLQLLQQHELHSKRRRTLEKLLTALPVIFTCLCEIWRCLDIIFLQSQIADEKMYVDLKQLDKLVRFLKHTLKISENFLKYSHKDSNEWIKAVELCRVFAEFRERLFPWNAQINTLTNGAV